MSRFMLNGIAGAFTKQDDMGFILGNNMPGITPVPYTVPESVYMMFQMTFAIITPALIAGAFADRMKFSAMCIFMVGWSIFSYSLIAHWVWAPTGWLSTDGHAGLCRRHRRAHQRGRGRIDVLPGDGQARRLRA